MAKFEIKFIDCSYENAFIKCEVFDTGYGGYGSVINISGISDEDKPFNIWLDKSTAIKFAKTLRTEINKITESEVRNGK